MATSKTKKETYKEKNKKTTPQKENIKKKDTKKEEKNPKKEVKKETKTESKKETKVETKSKTTKEPEKVEKIKEVKAKEEVKKSKPKKTKKITEADLEKTTVFVSEEFTNKKLELEQKAIKKQKRREILKEIRAFFILVICIGLISLGAWYWYTHIYNQEPKREHQSEKVEKKVDEYKTVKYTIANEDDYLEVLNDSFLLEKDKKYIYKIMDLKGNTLFEGKETFEHIYEGVDNQIYAYNINGTEFESIVELYRLEDNSFKRIETISYPNVKLNSITYEDENGFKKLIGFSGTSSTYDEDLNSIVETKVYTIKEKELSLKNYYIAGDNESTHQTDIITYDPTYIIIYTYENGKKNYGLYDLKEDHLVIKPQYEGLYTNGINYIAIKNGKAGVITSKLKKIVDFQYDFIDRQDSYYVVSKNNKLAIMDEDYHLVTNFVFDYQKTNDNQSYSYNLEKDNINTFKSVKKNNTYILTINNGEELGYTYNKHETYIITNSKEIKTITSNLFHASNNNSLVYSYDKENKKYTIYDQELEKSYDINLSEYDYNNYPTIELVNENTLAINLNSKIYFNYETGEEIEHYQDYQTVVNGVKITYDNSKENVEYQVNNETLATIPVDVNKNHDYYHKIDDKVFYYNTGKDYVYIEKGE